MVFPTHRILITGNLECERTSQTSYIAIEATYNEIEFILYNY